MTPPQTEPTTQDRDRGLYPKYRITKADGRPTDLTASCFVRLDGQDPRAQLAALDPFRSATDPS